MKHLLNLLILFACVGCALAQSVATNAPSTTISTNRCAEFVLKDQFDKSHTIKFPATKPILLTVADRKGSDGIEAWAHPVAVEFGERIEIAGVGDVSAVPRLLRSFIRGKFKQAIAFPTMLDWEGKVSAGFKYVKDQPNIYLVARDGRILKVFSGEADAKRLAELSAAIKAELGPVPAH